MADESDVAHLLEGHQCPRCGQRKIACLHYSDAEDLLQSVRYFCTYRAPAALRCGWEDDTLDPPPGAEILSDDVADLIGLIENQGFRVRYFINLMLFLILIAGLIFGTGLAVQAQNNNLLLHRQLQLQCADLNDFPNASAMCRQWGYK